MSVSAAASQQPKIRSFPRRLALEVLSGEQVALVHSRSLDILSRVGVTTSNERLLKAMADHSQRVDIDAKRIRFDPSFVEERLAMATRHYTLAARDPACDLPLDGKRSYLSTDGCPADVIDLESGRRRASTKQDIADISRVADALPQIGVVWQSASANDVPVAVRPIHETHAQWAATGKHIQQMTAIDPFNARGIVEMASTVAGGSSALRDRPIISNFQCSISPLHWDDGPIAAMEVFAAAGIPVGICSMPLAAASAPLSVAGLLTMSNAEILSGLVILETLVPGAKTFYVNYASTIDLHSGSLNPAWGGEEIFTEMAATQMARHYGVVSSAGAFGTGSPAPDWQAGVHGAMSCMGAILMPGDMLTGVGSLAGDSVYSLAQLLLDCEIFEMASRWVDGFPIDDEHIALDTIEQVGPGGHFLDADHTLEHVRDFWSSRYMSTSTWTEWEQRGRPHPADAATAEAKRMLAEHEPPPLEDGVERELAAIVQAYERQAQDSGI
jgi:trimethylamine---corrinoid protein Co-methyltransferase